MRKLAVAFTFSCLAAPALATGLEIEVAGEANGTVTIDLLEDVAPAHVDRITTWPRTAPMTGWSFIASSTASWPRPATCSMAGSRAATWRRAGHGRQRPARPQGRVQRRPFERGVVGMARGRDPDSANAQFFIMFAPAPHLTGNTRRWAA